MTSMTHYRTAALPSLSHCTQLRYLDLSWVMSPKKLTFSALKRSLSNLMYLETLRLPVRKFPIDDMLPDTPWPPKIKELHIGGIFSYQALETINWPPVLVNLTINWCEHPDAAVAHLALLLRGVLPADASDDNDDVLLRQKLPNLKELHLEPWAQSFNPFTTGMTIRQLNRAMALVALPDNMMQSGFFDGFETMTTRYGEPMVIDRLEITVRIDTQKSNMVQQLTRASGGSMKWIHRFVMQTDLDGSVERFHQVGRSSSDETTCVGKGTFRTSARIRIHHAFPGETNRGVFQFQSIRFVEDERRHGIDGSSNAFSTQGEHKLMRC